MGLLGKIVGRNSPAATAPPANCTALADRPVATAVSSAAPPLSSAALPPPLPCLLCGCPGIWSTIYEPDAYRCCDCEPPPGGWYVKMGGRQFVARRLMLVIWHDVWQWEDF